MNQDQEEQPREPGPDFVFEVSWEVCNKVGGISTVIASKAKQMLEHYGDRFMLIGPYFYDKARASFQEEPCPGTLKECAASLEKEGIIAHFGRWLIPGNPRTVLLEFSGFSKNTNSIKKELWETYKIDSLGTAYHDYDEPVVWGYAAARLIEGIMQAHPEKKAVVHAHEWLSGSAVLCLKKKQPRIATVFTTHATMLGRTIAGSGRDLYDELEEIDPEAEAARYGIRAKHLTEVACANTADVFTTVSEITALEAERILGKAPDIITPNGLDMSSFPTFEELSINHRNFRMKINEFLMAYFFPYYSFDTSKTLLFFIVGRYEFHVKGIDLFIDSLAELNQMLKEEGSEKTVAAFFFIPANIRGVKPVVLENKTFFNDIKDTINDSIKEIEGHLLEYVLSRSEVCEDNLFSEEKKEELKRKLMRMEKKGNPPLSTHDLVDNESDPILSAFRRKGLLNAKDDKVKVIYYPVYLNGADGLLDLDYYETIQGTHLGVFPSAYEPWGYTPLETGALGVASVTSDAAGFGRFIRGQTRDEAPGIFVIDRFRKSYDEAKDQLTKTLHFFTELTKSERVKNKMEARRLASLAEWRDLIKAYFSAHRMALLKTP